MNFFPANKWTSVLFTLSLLLVLVSLLPFLGMVSIWFEVWAHFRHVYFVLAMLGLGGAIIFKPSTGFWKILVLLIFSAGINFAAILPFYLNPSVEKLMEKKSQKTTLVVFHANVLSSNHQHSRLLRQIEEVEPDILSLQEINNRWLQALEPVLEHYPHRLLAAREDNFGLVLLSKIPADTLRGEAHHGSGFPAILGSFRIGDLSIRLVTVHAVPPVYPGSFPLRNSQLRASAKSLGETGPRIFLGDWNITAWSPVFRRIKNQTGLRDARRGFGLLSTWFVQGKWALLPIDQLLVSNHFTVQSIRTGEPFGSDHLPVIAELVLK